MKYLYKLICISAILVATLYSCGNSSKLQDGEYSLDILSTNDIHGAWFSRSYTDSSQKKSLLNISTLVSKFRDSIGAGNVILVDAGDCLQGDNAPYFFNYIDTQSTHLFVRMVDYLKYDAIAVGNHDIETGHPVYDRVRKELDSVGIPFLAANAIRNDNGRPYFQPYKIINRGGLKVAILGYTNPNMKAWLAEEVWSGMHFESLLPLVQNDVDKVIKREKPNVVVVVVHSGVGSGDASILESQGLDLFNTLRGVDFLICSHDHRAFIAQNDSIALLNSGSHSRNIAHGKITLTVQNGAIVDKRLTAELLSTPTQPDTLMEKFFYRDYERVKEFTLTPVGALLRPIKTREAFVGMSDYINLIHTVGLRATNAQISFAAPLSYNKEIPSGVLVYNDLFTIYPYENQLYVIKLTGEEIKNYLEFSYDNWITTTDPEHLLKIHQREDSRYSQKGWSFIGRSYNFDSAGGINYTVDTKAPIGERIHIYSLADGSTFNMDQDYTVAITSYRASGGGDILSKGASVDVDKIEERIVARYPEFRELIYSYLKNNGSIDYLQIGDTSLIGKWMFIPEKEANARLEKDMKLLFRM